MSRGRMVSALWVGSPLGSYEQMCLQSFAYSGYRVNLFTYDSSITAPSGVQHCDANDVLPSDLVFRNHDGSGSFAAFSNLFRYALLQQVETVWIDTDVLKTGRDLPTSDYLFGREDSRFINGAVLGAPPMSKFLSCIAEEAAKVDPQFVAWGDLGPKLITRIACELELDAYAQAENVFYPIRMRDVWRLFDPREIDWVRSEISDASSVHLWNEILRRAPRPVKIMAPPVGSYLYEYWKALDLSFEGLESIDPLWVRTTWREFLNPSLITRANRKFMRTIRRMA